MAKGKLSSPTFQFWIGTIVGGIVISLAGATLARYTSLGLVSAEIVARAATEYAISVTQKPAKSIEEAQEHDRRLRDFDEQIFVDFAGAVGRARKQNEEQLQTLKQRRADQEAQYRLQVQQAQQAAAASVERKASKAQAREERADRSRQENPSRK